MTTKIDNTLSETFNVTPAVKEEPAQEVIVYDKNDDPKEPDGTDYKYAQENIKRIIDGGMELFDVATRIAKQGEQPKAFDTATNILKIVTDANKALLDIQDKKNKITGATTKKTGRSAEEKVTNNNLIIGSSNDLAKISREIHEMRKKGEDDTT